MPTTQQGPGEAGHLSVYKNLQQQWWPVFSSVLSSQRAEVEGQLDCPKVADQAEGEDSERWPCHPSGRWENLIYWGRVGLLDSQFNILPLCYRGSQMAFILSGFSINKLNALLSGGLCCLATFWQPPWGMQLRQMNRLANEWGLGCQYSPPQELCISPAE